MFIQIGVTRPDTQVIQTYKRVRKQLVWVQTIERKKASRSLSIHIGPPWPGSPPGWLVTRRRQGLRRTHRRGRCCRLKTINKQTWVQRYSASLTSEPNIHAHSQEGGGVIPASQPWLLANLSYSTPLVKQFSAHESTNHQHNIPPGILPRRYSRLSWVF